MIVYWEYQKMILKAIDNRIIEGESVRDAVRFNLVMHRKNGKERINMANKGKKKDALILSPILILKDLALDIVVYRIASRD